MLILASASPRRQELLRNAGIQFSVQAADIDETPLTAESPRECAERLARAKAVAIANKCPQDFVLGADTIVVVDGAILGKPRDARHATHMLQLLSGRAHTVITGVCLVSPTVSHVLRAANLKEPKACDHSAVAVSSESTLVTMCELSENEICDYVATREPMDKAGAYAIQGMASRWIPRIQGDYSNVVGLPVAMVYAMLKKCGAV